MRARDRQDRPDKPERRHHKDQTNRWIEVRAGDRPEYLDQHSQDAPVDKVFPSSARATFPPASRSAMRPEPITVATSNAVPTASAANRRAEFSITRVDGRSRGDDSAT